MQIRSHLGVIAAALVFVAASGAYAQNLTITNARILDGTGRVIERGAVVVRDGKVVSVSAAAPTNTSGRTINANGKTVMPGLVDGHRHIVTGDAAQWLTQRASQQFQEFLEAGFTTVLAAIDPPQVIEARKRIEAGQMKGPRLYVGTFIPVAGPTGPPPNGDPLVPIPLAVHCQRRPHPQLRATPPSRPSRAQSRQATTI
jgi:cytosine/adenosine deaminase-related metal-dependent hydrolase